MLGNKLDLTPPWARRHHRVQRCLCTPLPLPSLRRFEERDRFWNFMNEGKVNVTRRLLVPILTFLPLIGR